MANLLKITELLNKKNIPIGEFAKSIGISYQGLNKIIRENSTKIETLELIAQKLDVSISVFFEEKEESPPNNSDDLKTLIDSNALLTQTNAKLTETNTKLTDRLLEITEDTKKRIAGSA